MTVFEKCGFRVKRARTIDTDVNYWKQHYDVWKNKDFYPSLVEDLSKTPLILAIDWLHPVNCSVDIAIKIARKMLGSSDPRLCDVSTIRGTYASSVRFNFCHISDSLTSYLHEVNLAFPPSSSSSPHVSNAVNSDESKSCSPSFPSLPSFIDNRKDKNSCNICSVSLHGDKVIKCSKGHDFHKRCLGDVENLCPLCGSGLSRS
jgi:nucleoside diphosphate kinase